VDNITKAQFGSFLKNKLKLNKKNIAFIGDSDADIGLAKYSNLSFAYNT
jgi:hydroxymethylpyrimidine pyrophosphatase-like HAD family hydrolase